MFDVVYIAAATSVDIYLEKKNNMGGNYRAYGMHTREKVKKKNSRSHRGPVETVACLQTSRQHTPQQAAKEEKNNNDTRYI